LESIWFTVDRSIFTHLYNALIETFPQVHENSSFNVNKTDD
jgi:hypothetical protein